LEIIARTVDDCSSFFGKSDRGLKLREEVRGSVSAIVRSKQQGTYADGIPVGIGEDTIRSGRAEHIEMSDDAVRGEW
jgi:hypothetical protein